MKNEFKFILIGADVIRVLVCGDKIIPTDCYYQLEDFEIFDSREDAMYSKLLDCLKAGKSLDNYKSSKYYKMYVERLKKEYPEYII